MAINGFVLIGGRRAYPSVIERFTPFVNGFVCAILYGRFPFSSLIDRIHRLFFYLGGGARNIHLFGGDFVSLGENRILLQAEDRLANVIARFDCESN